MRTYASLTRPGQLRRLRSLALAAARQYGISVRRLWLVADSFNVLYRIEATEGENYLLRIGPTLRIHVVGIERVEAAWLEALHGQAGLAVARVIKQGDGVTTTVGAPGIPEPRECTLFTWVPGRSVWGRMTADIAQLSGALLASLHAHASAWNDPNLELAPLANQVLYFDDEPRFSQLRRHRSLFVDACDRAQATIDQLWASPAHPPHLLHGDLTPNNLVLGQLGLVPIDFQDMIVGLEIQDVAISLHPFTRQSNGAELAAAFQIGYQRLRPWPVDDEATLMALFAARRLLMANLALNLARPGMDAYIDAMAARLASWME